MDKTTPIKLLVLNEHTRQHLLAILQRNNFQPEVASDPSKLLGGSISPGASLFFVDWEAVNVYGLGLISQIIRSSPGYRVIYLYDKGHRDLIRHIMDLGVFGCIMAPYEEWEILTMIRHLSIRKPAKPNLPNKGQAFHPE